MTTWDVTWIHGEADEPAYQVHWYDESTAFIRQSKRTSYEAPYLAVLLGEERALLLDTGARPDWPLREALDVVLAGRAEDYELVVAHTHGHTDHTSGDGQLADRPHTTVVGAGIEDVTTYFKITEWPAQQVGLDLGGRVLDVIPSPGHHRAAVTYFDRRTGILLTGDTVMPGRLLVFDGPAYAATLDRLVDFARDHDITWVVGCHTELRSDGSEYAPARIHQPDEAPLQLPPGVLTDLQQAYGTIAGRRGVHHVDGFVIYNEPRLRNLVAMNLWALWDRIRPSS